MSKASSESSRRKATLEPQGELIGLSAWWKAEALNVFKYRMYKIKVGVLDCSTLSFEFVGDGWQNHPKREQSVDLDIPAYVYPEIPSTIRNAKKDQYAFLLLTDAFMKQATNIGDDDLANYAEAGGKWPFGAAGIQLTKSDALEALATLRASIEGWPDDLK
jgi:hypothetical protein